MIQTSMQAFRVPPDKVQNITKKVRRSIILQLALACVCFADVLWLRISHYEAVWAIVIVAAVGILNLISGVHGYRNMPRLIINRLMQDLTQHPEDYISVDPAELADLDPFTKEDSAA